jgi:hypothetical protein
MQNDGGGKWQIPDLADISRGFYRRGVKKDSFA